MLTLTLMASIYISICNMLATSVKVDTAFMPQKVINKCYGT